MSGLAGVWRFERGDADADCARMLAALAVYGPDDESQWSDGPVSLGRRLKDMLPEDVFDRQPVRAADSRYVVLADARIDHRQDLERELGLSGPQAAETADATLVAMAVERWGEGAFDRLYGVFAVAAWDKVEHRLILARDPLAQRPLFYHRGKALFAFSSMPVGLQALPEVPRGPDEDEVREFMAGADLRSDRTHYQDIRRVLPGHVVIVTDKGLESRRYWNPSTTPLKLKSHSDYVEAMREHLDRAVRAQLRGAGGTVGAHLSGGFDSSAVAGTAAQLLAPSGGRVVAFTAVPREGYDIPDPIQMFADEGPLAAATAAMHPNMEHVLVRSQRSVLDNIDRASSLYGGPVTNLCNLVWVEAINDAAQNRGLKVVLNGLYGNASLSYSGVGALPELIGAHRYGDWLRLARATVRRGKMRWRGVMMNSLSPYMPGPLYQRLMQLSGRGQEMAHRSSPLPPEAFEKLHANLQAQLAEGAESWALTYGDVWDRPSKNGIAHRLALYGGDEGAFEKGVLARWGIDERDPTADRHLAEFSLTVPTEQFFYDGEPKALIKHVLAGRVAPAVLENTRKGYQGADWHESLTQIRDRLPDEIERIEAFEPSQRMVDVARLKRLLDEWPQDGWEGEDKMADYRHTLLRALSAAHFLRKAAGSNL